MKTGKVWLVGAGPGDIGLFTLKGLKVLEQADVVVYDSLVGQGVLSRIPENARLINVGKRASHHIMRQENINQVLLEEAQRGLRVDAPERRRIHSSLEEEERSWSFFGRMGSLMRLFRVLLPPLQYRHITGFR